MSTQELHDFLMTIAYSLSTVAFVVIIYRLMVSMRYVQPIVSPEQAFNFNVIVVVTQLFLDVIGFLLTGKPSWISGMIMSIMVLYLLNAQRGRGWM